MTPRVRIADAPVVVMREDDNGVLIRAQVTAGRRWHRLTYNEPRFSSANVARMWLNRNGRPDHIYVLVPYIA